MFMLANVWDAWEGDGWAANMKSPGSKWLILPREDGGGLDEDSSGREGDKRMMGLKLLRR